MKTTIEFVTRMKEMYNGEPWFGEPFQTKLKDVSEGAALHQPNGEHSIAQLVSHMEFWRRSVLHKLTGDTSIAFTSDHPDNWPDAEAVKTKGWNQIKNTFVETQTALIQALNTNGTIADDIASALGGTLDHDIYHLGQIGYIKKLVNR